LLLFDFLGLSVRSSDRDLRGEDYATSNLVFDRTYAPPTIPTQPEKQATLPIRGIFTLDHLDSEAAMTICGGKNNAANPPALSGVR
jgi:hypothetical protein